MAATAETSNHLSPRGTGFSGDGPGSPLNRRRGSLSPPWAQVVRGESLSSPAEQPNFRDCSARSTPSSPDNMAAQLCNGREKGNAGRSKPAWSKPSNVVIESGTVMGAVSWPALSGSARPSPKSSPDPSLNNIDGSVSTSQVQAPIIQPVIPLSHNKQAASTIPSSSSNHALPVQQRYMKRGGGNSSQTGGGHSQSGFFHPPPPPPFPFFQLPPSSYNTLVSPLPNSSPLEPPYRPNNWETRPIAGFVPQLHMVNDHRSNSRSGNYGPRGRDHMLPQRGTPRGIVRSPSPTPHNIAPFINLQTVRPFPTPISFSDATSQLGYYPQLLSFGGVPFIAPQHPPFFIPPPDKPLHVRLLDQIEFYFSDANLIKDDFLKSKMDEQGWVPITLIAGFPRVKGLTNNVQLILDCLRTSTVIEVQDEKLRRRSEWMKQLPNYVRLPTESGASSSGEANYNMLVTSFSKMTVEEMKSKQGDICLDAVTRTSSGSARQEQLSNVGDLC